VKLPNHCFEMFTFQQSSCELRHDARWAIAVAERNIASDRHSDIFSAADG